MIIRRDTSIYTHMLICSFSHRLSLMWNTANSRQQNHSQRNSQECKTHETLLKKRKQKPLNAKNGTNTSSSMKRVAIPRAWVPAHGCQMPRLPISDLLEVVPLAAGPRDFRTKSEKHRMKLTFSNDTHMYAYMQFYSNTLSHEWSRTV